LEEGCLILTASWLVGLLAACLTLAGLITSGLCAQAYNEALFVAQSLTRTENSKKTAKSQQQQHSLQVEESSENMCICHLVKMGKGEEMGIVVENGDCCSTRY